MTNANKNTVMVKLLKIGLADMLRDIFKKLLSLSSTAIV